MVSLVDTSVWVEYLRATGSVADLALTEAVTMTPAAIATCEAVRMEVLAGPTDPFAVRRLEAQLDSLDRLDIDPVEDFRTAAAIARDVRRSGHTVRSIVDCLIAAVAIRHDAELWHRDEDFVRIAGVTALRHRDLR